MVWSDWGVVDGRQGVDGRRRSKEQEQQNQEGSSAGGRVRRDGEWNGTDINGGEKRASMASGGGVEEEMETGSRSVSCEAAECRRRLTRRRYAKAT